MKKQKPVRRECIICERGVMDREGHMIWLAVIQLLLKNPNAEPAGNEVLRHILKTGMHTDSLNKLHTLILKEGFNFNYVKKIG